MARNQYVQGIIDGMMKKIADGDFPEAQAWATFAPVPMTKWSWGNRFLCALERSQDARGCRQWNKVGRMVLKGEKAFHILAPITKKVKVENPDNKDETRDQFVGFRAVPVFDVSQTDGDTIDYQATLDMPIDLGAVATDWGLTVGGKPGGTGSLAHYSSTGKEIRMAAPSFEIFCHELSHAAHDRIEKRAGRELLGGQVPEQELVAELASMTLVTLYGQQHSNAGAAYQYLVRYAKGRDVYAACLPLLKTVDAVCREIADAAAAVGVAV